MARSGDSFLGGKGAANPVSNLYAPTELKWTDRILFAINSMLGIDVPEKLRLSVFVQSYAIGKPGDSAVDLTMPAKDWSLIGFVKAFAPLALEYKTELEQVNATLTTVLAELQTLNATTTQINTGVSAVLSEVQDVDINLTQLNTTATDIRTRMDAPFTTI